MDLYFSNIVTILSLGTQVAIEGGDIDQEKLAERLQMWQLVKNCCNSQLELLKVVRVDKTVFLQSKIDSLGLYNMCKSFIVIT